MAAGTEHWLLTEQGAMASSVAKKEFLRRSCIVT